MTDFEKFWSAFPRKVAKLAAMRAFAKAIKLATVDMLLVGVENYKKSKPEYADWCHPATWLNAGRWMDEPDTTNGHACPVKSASQLILAQNHLTRVEERIKTVKGQMPFSPGSKLSMEWETLKSERSKLKQQLGFVA